LEAQIGDQTYHRVGKERRCLLKRGRNLYATRIGRKEIRVFGTKIEIFHDTGILIFITDTVATGGDKRLHREYSLPVIQLLTGQKDISNGDGKAIRRRGNENRCEGENRVGDNAALPEPLAGIRGKPSAVNKGSTTRLPAAHITQLSAIRTHALNPTIVPKVRPSLGAETALLTYTVKVGNTVKTYSPALGKSSLPSGTSKKDMVRVNARQDRRDENLLVEGHNLVTHMWEEGNGNARVDGVILSHG